MSRHITSGRRRWRATMNAWRPSSVLHALDVALVDPPSLCCDDDDLCPACRAESSLVGCR